MVTYILKLQEKEKVAGPLVLCCSATLFLLVPKDLFEFQLREAKLLCSFPVIHAAISIKFPLFMTCP